MVQTTCRSSCVGLSQSARRRRRLVQAAAEPSGIPTLEIDIIKRRLEYIEWVCFHQYQVLAYAAVHVPPGLQPDAEPLPEHPLPVGTQEDVDHYVSFGHVPGYASDVEPDMDDHHEDRYTEQGDYVIMSAHSDLARACSNLEDLHASLCDRLYNGSSILAEIFKPTHIGEVLPAKPSENELELEEFKDDAVEEFAARSPLRFSA